MAVMVCFSSVHNFWCEHNLCSSSKMIFLLIFSLLCSKVLGNADEHSIECNLQNAKCIEDAVKRAYIYVKDGMPEYNIPPVDPLILSQLEIEPNEFIGFHQNYTNATLYGLKDFPLKTAKYDKESRNIVMSVSRYEFRLTSFYELKGHFLMFPVAGNGDVLIILQNATINLQFDLDVVTRHGGKYFKGKNSKLWLDLERVTFQFNNLFNGHELLGKNLNNLFNENWKPLFELTVPAFLQGFGVLALRKFNWVFQKMPIVEVP